MNKYRIALIAMSFVAVTLGLMLTRQHAALTLTVSNLENRLDWIHRTAKSLRDANGSIELYDTHKTDDLLAVFANRPDVFNVATETTDVSANGIAVLATLPNLEVLRLSGESLGALGLEGLAELKGLKQLSLNYTDASGAELKVLAKLPSLISVSIEGGWEEGEIEAVVTALSALKSLKRLRLGTWADEAVAEELRRELPGCEVVRIG